MTPRDTLLAPFALLLCIGHSLAQETSEFGLDDCLALLPGEPAKNQKPAYQFHSESADSDSRCEGFYDELQSFTDGVTVVSTVVDHKSIPVSGLPDAFYFHSDVIERSWISIRVDHPIGYQADAVVPASGIFRWQQLVMEEQLGATPAVSIIGYRKQDGIYPNAYIPISIDNMVTETSVLFLGVRVPQDTERIRWRLGCRQVSELDLGSWSVLELSNDSRPFIPIGIEQLPNFVEIQVATRSSRPSFHCIPLLG